MKMRHTILGAAAVAAAGMLLGVATPSASAALTTYQYIAQPQGGSFSVGTNTVNLYLQEVVPSGGFTTSNPAGENGLGGAGIVLVEQPGGTGVTITGETANTAAEPNGFTFNHATGGLTNGSNGGWVQEVSNFFGASSGVMPVNSSTDQATGTTTNQYFLGTMTVQLDPGGSANFNVESFFNAPTGSFAFAGQHAQTVTFATQQDLDPNSAQWVGGDNGTTVLNVSAVPEPASMAVFALGAVGLLARRRKTA